jgi:hypothetical protein
MTTLLILLTTVTTAAAVIAAIRVAARRVVAAHADALAEPASPRTVKDTSPLKLVVLIVVAIFVAFLLIRGALGFTGQTADPNSYKPNYELVPCEVHPEAYGC